MGCTCQVAKTLAGWQRSSDVNGDLVASLEEANSALPWLVDKGEMQVGKLLGGMNTGMGRAVQRVEDWPVLVHWDERTRN